MNLALKPSEEYYALHVTLVCLQKELRKWLKGKILLEKQAPTQDRIQYYVLVQEKSTQKYGVFPVTERKVLYKIGLVRVREGPSQPYCILYKKSIWCVVEKQLHRYMYHAGLDHMILRMVKPKCKPEVAVAVD